MNRTGAPERLGRILAIVPWVAAQDGPLVVDVSRRFGIAEDELLADLELLFLCGIHPFTPDTLIEVDLAEGRVWIRFADYFRAPLRLTAPEGLALLAAGSALLAVPGADPHGALARALAKVETVLGIGPGDSFDVELAAVQKPILDAIRRGASEHRRVEITYYSFGRDGHSRRVVHPWRVFNHSGQWYLDGWCELAAAPRMFRVDRIGSAVLTGQSFPPAPAATATERSDRVFAPSPDDPVTVLDLAPEAHWIAERYPNEGVERRSPACLRVRLRSAQRAWLERLVLRAGPHATVVEGDADLPAQAARRVLARYVGTGSGPP